MKVLHLIGFLFLVFGGFSDLSAQKKMPWKKRARNAASLEKSGDFYQAAISYESIYNEKNDKKEYAFKAGVCYLKIRDYKNAVKNLEHVKEDEEEYNKVGYMYAVALKQSGKAEQAKKAFKTFLSNYSGDDKLVMKEQVDNEVAGCDFALKAQEYTDPNVSLSHLGAKINTDKSEFGPIAFNDNVLYFSSSFSGVAKIYRSQKKGDSWSKPQMPGIFNGIMEKPHFGNGSFTPDGKRFYFTQCDIKEAEKPQCAIYLMVEENGKWSKPVKLPDYINPEEANTTHPCVVIIGDKEVLYFASDRTGGKGGLDLWYCSRTLNSRGNNFTLPKNLGRNINSLGDEITPFYNKDKGELYFSSNGRVSAGGFDIFKSKGEGTKWELAQNMGFPVNSASDDLYYLLNEAHEGGYLVSNRSFGNKEETSNDDIFHFGKDNIEVGIKGQITALDGDADELLQDLNINLFEINSGEEELVEDRMLLVGEYKFTLQPQKQYLIEIKKEGFKTASFEVSTVNFKRSETVVKDIQMQRDQEEVASVAEPEETDYSIYDIVPAEYDSQENPFDYPSSPNDPITGEPYTGKLLEIYEEYKEKIASNSPDMKVYYDGPSGPLVALVEDVVVEEPIEEPIEEPVEEPVEEPSLPDVIVAEGVVYKIQVSAVRRFKESRYEDLKQIGVLDFEELENDVTRVMVIPDGDNEDGTTGFKSKKEALKSLAFVMNNTRFDRAFVIKYVNGERVGDGFRGWDEEEGLNEGVEDKRPDEIKDAYEGF